MIFELAQQYYGLPHLYNALLEHYQIIPAAPGPEAAAPALGRDFSFQFTYEHSATATARRNPAYRYVRLPARIDLSELENAFYPRTNVTMPGLGVAGADRSVTIPASGAMWGLTIPKKAANPEQALAFVAMVLGPMGTAALNENGPSPITPALVSSRDYGHVPRPLRALVSPKPAVP